MADFLATVLAKMTVLLIEKLIAHLTRTAFVTAMTKRLNPVAHAA